MDKTYSIILNSSNTTNATVVNGNAHIQYFINWQAMLPQGDIKFSTKATFQTVATGTGNNADVSGSILIYADFGTRTLYDQTMSSSQVICMAQPDSYYTTTTALRSFYANAISPRFMCSIPSNNIVNIQIKEIDGKPITTCPPYILTMEFTVIE
jgi:hypothetical protein